MIVSQRRVGAFATLALLALLPGRLAFAAGTDPSLALTAARAFTASTGAITVQATGMFNFDDVLQFSFPAGLIVVQGTSFARYQYDGGRSSGNAAFLADGLGSNELPALLALGAPAPPAALLQFQPATILVALPASFAAGPAYAVVYAVLENTPFLSNPVAFTIPTP